MITLILGACKPKTPLPVLGNEPVANFSFINQDSSIITNKTFDGKIYVANFFFTSCTTICPQMQSVMKDIFQEYRDNPNLMFLSHTIDYKYDTPSKLKLYAQKLNVDVKKWQFAYGSKEKVYGIAEKSYMSAVLEDEKVKENFIHQGYLLLVDKHRRVRGAYDSDSPEQVELLKEGITQLLNE